MVPRLPACARHFNKQFRRVLQNDAPAGTRSITRTLAAPTTATGLEKVLPQEPEVQATPTSAESEKVQGPLHSLLRAVKLSFGFAATATCATVGYVTYAYKTEEVEERMDGLRSLIAETSAAAEGKGLVQEAMSAIYTGAVNALVSAGDLYVRTRHSLEDQISGLSAPASNKLLPDLHPSEVGHVYTLVLDLNETLVFSDWTRERGWRTFKRPGVDAFLEQLAPYFEIVVYSDQLSTYVDPVVDRLDTKGAIRFRLDRSATQYIHGKCFRDMSKLNRDPARMIYIGPHAKESCLQPENALDIKPFKMEAEDTTLLDFLPFLESIAKYRPPDVRAVLASFEGQDIPSAFRERAKEMQRKLQERRQRRPSFFGGPQPPAGQS